MISPTGVWGVEEQEGHIFSPNIALWVDKNTSGLIIDLGAGSGKYTRYLRRLGRQCLSVDGFQSGGIDVILDLSKDISVDGKIGNVLCLEVFEHIPKQYEDTLVNNIVKLCSRKLIISVAHEGQEGTGHVNCQNEPYVISLFECRGFKLNQSETNQIRKVPEKNVVYFRKNLFVFER